MEGKDLVTQTVEQCLMFTPESIDNYLNAKQDEGVAASAVKKYREALNNLRMFLGDNLTLQADRLQAWRQHMITAGYSKHTIQRHITRVNSYLRYYGRDDLHIPKPLRNDLRDQTFGYLTAIAPTDKRYRKDIIWKCRCRCGKEIEVPATSLTQMNTTSCGCRKTEILQHNNRYQEGTELRRSLEETVHNPNSASGYVGVQPKRDKWIACINYKGGHYHLGTYTNLEDAVKARARAKEAVMEDAARIYAETDHLYGDAPLRPPKPEREAAPSAESTVIPARYSNNTSGCPGVTRNKGKWSASISVNRFRYSLGAYEVLEDAIAARKQAEELVQAGDLDKLRAICTNGKK